MPYEARDGFAAAHRVLKDVRFSIRKDEFDSRRERQY
jgi:hypothetical protein